MLYTSFANIDVCDLLEKRLLTKLSMMVMEDQLKGSLLRSIGQHKYMFQKAKEKGGVLDLLLYFMDIYYHYGPNYKSITRDNI